MVATMTNKTFCNLIAAATAVCLLAANPALAVKVGDVARFQGEFPNRVMGMGLVVGLPGTGDGGDYMPAMRPLSNLLARMANPIGTAGELKEAKNAAIVMVEATLPANGVREGDRIDVQISSVGAAKSLAGGRLLMTPLLAATALTARSENQGPGPDILAFASGPLSTSDPKAARTAFIRNGATIEANMLHRYLVLGRELEQYRAAREQGGEINGPLLDWIRPNEPYITLVIGSSHASWAMANVMAQMISDMASDPDLQGRPRRVEDMIALAADRNNVLVRVPETARKNLAPFLARVETLELLMPETEARVIVNRVMGSIIITGDVEISPVTITYKGMTIQTQTPPPKPTPEAPLLDIQQFAALDPGGRGGAKLKDLVASLNSLKLPPADRVHIIEELHRLGKLHARLIVEE